MVKVVQSDIPEYGRIGLDVRDQLIMQFGEAAVQWAEMATVVQLLFAVGIIKPDEFIDLVRKQCVRADDRRRRQAGFKD